MNGEINHQKGIVDISYEVSGDKASGTLHFESRRRSKKALWELQKWDLTLPGEQPISLSQDDGGGISAVEVVETSIRF